jgi:Sporulation and spore germination
MIPRYQRILFWSLIGGIFLMAAFLVRGCQQAHKRLTALNDAMPIAAPNNAGTEDISLYIANDADASVSIATKPLALPSQPTLRARALLQQLLAAYSIPSSNHPLPVGPSVDDVFLLNLPLTNPPTPVTESTSDITEALGGHTTGELAVINLHGSFADGHPSGIVVEDLTLKSIIGTLHAALPQITEIRFLVDGEPRETLAGHADLLHTYPAADTASKPTPPTGASEAQP